MRFLDIPSSRPSYPFPLDTIDIKSSNTGGYIECPIINLTKYRARFWVDRPWSRFQGPFVDGYRDRVDAHWRWHTFVRRLRKKKDLIRCGAIQTPDGEVQGAIIYRRDGTSLLERNTGALYIEYLAAAPANRKDCAKRPLYSGVGEGLLTLAILQSYVWGLGGRVALFSLPSAIGFYKKFDFVETGTEEDRMIHCELGSGAAVNHLEMLGLIS